MSFKSEQLSYIKDKLSQINTKWVYANSILYKMCKEHPEHNNADYIVAKIWLIGRSYAAAIERRRKNKNEENTDDFYYEIVAPKLIEIGSELDKRISYINQLKKIDEESVPYILETHKLLTDTFNEMTDLAKRSLASKYLHFHCPKAFFIFDSRAKTGINKFIKKDRNTEIPEIKNCDEEYKDFFFRMLELQKTIEQKLNKKLNPRNLDGLLLGY